MRQILHMSYAAVFLAFGAPGKAVDASARVRGYRDFHDRVWSGEIRLDGSEAKIEYARVHLKQALEEMHAARFEEARRIIGDFHKHDRG